MLARTLIIGPGPDQAASLRFRDRAIALGVPMLLVPLVAFIAYWWLQPPGNSPWVFLLLPAYGAILSVPAYPVVLAASYVASRRGWIGLIPFALSGAILAGGAALIFASIMVAELQGTLWEFALTAMSWSAMGAVYAALAWLTLLVLRPDLYSG